MTTDPVISRALDYPYSSPAYDFVLKKGSVARLQDKSSLAGRIPVLAIGSNRSPEQLLRKFSERDILPVTCIQLCGEYDVAYNSSQFMIPGSFNLTSFAKVIDMAVKEWKKV